MNRFLIFFLLAGILYALYRYQHLIFGNNDYNEEEIPKQNKYIKQAEKNNLKKLQYENKPKRITIDNISQLSLGSLEDEDGNPQMYKKDSIFDSLDSNTLMSEKSNESQLSKNDSFFF